VVSPAGAIGHACTARVIDWLFISDNEPDEIYPEYREDLQAIRFCPELRLFHRFGARFCGNCGEKLCLGK
jgi:hypothetical protein